ncbi:hypothetical protein BP6252_03029 [Coleophoma cylindrospora]|uniref:DUF6594 domain-containing protein n=1 Tax=Coleophoma cylindrospora TaxID=1849047 RepID=A0A3D8S6I1_9HELO|nr:hypothetical protein BP6252_03029 [Coleophoma cylindrospora]
MFQNKRDRITDNRDDGLVPKKLENFPRGYPRFSAYVDSDNDTVLFRRFGILHARSLVYKQVELTELEAQLNKLDKADAGTPEKDDNAWRIRYSIHVETERNQARKDLIDKIDQKLKEYDELLLLDARLRKLQRPSKRVHRNFFDYLYTEKPFPADDRRFGNHEHDFISLQDHEDSWLDELFHKAIDHARKGFFRKIFVTPEDQAKTDDPHHYYYSEERLGAVIKTVVAFMSAALLLLPIFLFTALKLSPGSMASVTLIFVLVFAAAISGLTSAKRVEVFAATAAYCAVLTVFIGNTQQKQ